MFLFVCVFLDVIFYSFFRLTIILSHVYITVSLCDVRLSHLNKDYLLTYLLTRWYSVETAQPIVKLSYCLVGYPHDSSFLRAKRFPGIPIKTPQPCKGVGKSCNFRPISRYSS